MPDDTNRGPLPGAARTAAQAIGRIEHAVEHAVEHLVDEVEHAVEKTERSLARRFGAGCVRGLHLTLKTVGVALLILYFAFGALLLAARYGWMPQVDSYRADIERVASRLVGARVSIGKIDASWRGVNPHLALTDVRLFDAAGSAALALPRIEATVSWLSVPTLQPRFTALSIYAPQLEIKRLPDGRLQVAGVLLDPQAGADRPAADWLLAQRHIAVYDAQLNFVDESGAAPRAVAFTEVEILLSKGLLGHRFALQARPPADLASPLDLRAEFTQPWSERPSDYTHWRGRVFAQMAYVDLARAADWVPLPVASTRIERGQGALRVWVDFADASIDRVAADLALSDVVMQLAPDLEPLRLASLQGRVTQRAWGGALEGGHEFAAAQLSLQGAPGSGLSLAPTDLRYRYTRAAEGRPQRGDFTASRLSLDTLSGLAAHVPLARDLRAAIARHAVRGELADLRIVWDGEAAHPAKFSLRSRFSGLASAGLAADPPLTDKGKPRPGLPGFENLSGTIEANEAAGSVQVESTKAALIFPGVFDEPRLAFDHVGAQVHWRTQPALELRFDSFTARNAEVELSASGSYRAGGKRGDQGPGIVDLSGRIVRAQAAAAYKYVPLVAGEATRRWLQYALLGGQAVDGSWRLKGDLEDFPFASPRTGEFRVAARLREGVLDYVPAALAQADGAKHTPWPAIGGIEGEIVFERDRMEILAPRAALYGLQLSNVSARIPQIGARDARLLIGGQINGPVADMLRYVNASPVGALLGKFLATSRGEGSARGELKLDIPLAQAEKTQVAGAVTFQNNDIVLASDVPPFANVNGRLDFTEHSLKLSNVTAAFVGGQVQLAADTRGDGTIVISASGTATPQGAKRALDSPLLARLLDRAQGTTRYSGSVTVHGPRPQIRIESDLAGWNLDFPPPLRKPSAETLPLRIELVPLDAARDSVRVGLGTLLAVRYDRVGDTPGAPPRVERGAIRIADRAADSSAELPLPATGVQASLYLERLDLDRWTPLVGALAGGLTGGPESAAGADARRALVRDALPDLVAARIGELVLSGKSFANVVLGATRTSEGDETVWLGNVVSDHATGQIVWREPKRGSQGRISARLARLTIPEADRREVTELLDAPASDMPAFDVIAEDFVLGTRKLGRLELVAQNVGAGQANTWQLQKLALDTPEARLSASGQWTREAGSNARRMTLALSLDVANGGDLLNRLGMKDALRGGVGKLEGQINWRGSPFTIDYPSLGGKLQLELDKGQFLKAEPGVARLLGVVSLQSLPRRISLDFRDVFSEGFAFDQIRAGAEIANGILTTRDFKMRGPNATVAMDGTTDLRNETQNLRVLVLPEIDAGSASLAYALLANPAIGLGTFLAQMVLRDPLSKAFSHEYDVTGSWADPQVNKRERQARAQPTGEGPGPQPTR